MRKCKIIDNHTETIKLQVGKEMELHAFLLMGQSNAVKHEAIADHTVNLTNK
jgi:hypothetical protein